MKDKTPEYELCPYCGKECEVDGFRRGTCWYLQCVDCFYHGPERTTKTEAIKAHDKVCRLLGAQVRKNTQCG